MDLTGGEGKNLRVQLELVVKALGRLSFAAEGIQKALEFSLYPQVPGASFRTSPKTGEPLPEDGSWLSSTSEIKMAFEEWMAKEHGRPLNEEELTTLDNRFGALGNPGNDLREWESGILTDVRDGDEIPDGALFGPNSESLLTNAKPYHDGFSHGGGAEAEKEDGSTEEIPAGHEPSSTKV